MVTEIDCDKFLHNSINISYTDHKPTPKELAEFDQELALQKSYEDYKIGIKPWAIRIDSGAYAGSILKLVSTCWARSALPGGSDTASRQPTIKWVQNKKYDDTPYYATGIDGCLTITRWTSNPSDYIHLVADDGKVYKELFYRTAKTVLLDYDGPTEVVFTRKPKQEKIEKSFPKTVEDIFGNSIEQGGFCLYINYDNKNVMLIKFVGYKTQYRAIFQRIDNGNTFIKEAFNLIKVNLDEITESYIRITDQPAQLTDFVSNSLISLGLKSLTGDTCQAMPD